MSELKTHQLKLNEKYCDAVFQGRKCFEVRFNDRDYRVNDLIEFHAVTDEGLEIDHPIDARAYMITYLYDGPGLVPQHVVLGIRPTVLISDKALGVEE